MKNFVFDLYGTLADIHTDEDCEKFKSAMQKYFGMRNFTRRYKQLCLSLETGEGNCEIDLFKVFKELAPDAPQKAADRFRKKSRIRLKTYKGVRTLLKKLKAKGKRLYILSNAQACFTVGELKKLKINGFFDGIELSSDFGKKKPSAEFFAHVQRKYALESGDTVFIGNDYASDILGAKAAGLKTAYIKSNCSPQSDDLEQIAKTSDFATDKFKELYEYLLSL